GVRHLIVWSHASLHYVMAYPELFAPRWTSDPWHHFEYLDADPRAVAVESGRGRLAKCDLLGGQVELDSVKAGSSVIVRTNFHPSWSARIGGSDAGVALVDAGGQLGLRAPRDGSYAVELVSPRRIWLSALALVAILAGGSVLAIWPKPAVSTGIRH